VPPPMPCLRRRGRSPLLMALGELHGRNFASPSVLEVSSRPSDRFARRSANIIVISHRHRSEWLTALGATVVRRWAPTLAGLATLGFAGLVFAQAPPSTPDRPHLAKDVNEAIEFLGQWTRVSSGQEFFAGATYVGSSSCGGSGCHDQQVSEWRKTW